jgi:DNA-binding NarL/FixJ family response regulator
MKLPVKKALGSHRRRIFLVDDHAVTRQGLARLVNGEPDLEVCGEAGTAAQALAGIEAQKPELVVMDVSLGAGADGLELIQDLRSRDPGLRMLALSSRDETLYAERALRAGARGYVMKQAPTEVVLEAIRKTVLGEVYLSEPMTQRVLGKVTGAPFAPPGSETEHLSDSELEVYRLLGQGRGTRQIAAALHLSFRRVKSHRSHLKRKLCLPTSPELVRHAVEWMHGQAP